MRRGRGQQREIRREEPEQRRIALFRPDPRTGLTEEQARELWENGYGNLPVEPPVKSDREIIRENVCTFFNLIFVVLAVLLVLVGEYQDMLFLLIAAANTIIGIVQQIRSKRTIEKLNLLAEPTVRVVRGGRAREISVEELVREDIAELTAGVQIPADGVVLEGQIQVNEALITGEADLVPKNPGDEILSGSFVAAGRCRARMDKVGAQSYVSKLTMEAKAEGGAAKSEMMASLDRLIRVVGIALIPIGAAMFYNQYAVQGLGLRQSVVSMVAALIGMIPEGLYLLTSVALAVSVVRLAGRKTLIHDMKAIETLARVDVLCVDKTGTITRPEMHVADFCVLEEGHIQPYQAEEILSAFYRAADADNDTGRAMKERFGDGPAWDVREIIPFSSETKWSAVAFQREGAYVVGAPDFIMRARYREIAGRVAPYQEKGCRVLLLARCGGAVRTGSLPQEVTPLALIALHNPVRREAPETFAFFAAQKVAVKVISGDDPLTVSRVAAQAQVPEAGKYVDASSLKGEEAMREALERYTVFGRVTPDQKRQFVRLLQEAGHTVAMTGDGVNDVLALKDADCGIAMASGSDAARQVAQLVLLNSDFSCMPQVVDEGRRVINNIQRAAALYLVKNIFSFFLSLCSLYAGFPYPFKPLQLSMVSALTIGIPSFVLALEPNHDLVRGRFMHNVLRRAFPGGLTNLFMILGVELFAYAFSFSYESLSTMSTVLMGMVGLCVLYYVSRPLDWKRGLLLGAMGAGLVVCVAWKGDLFSISPLNLGELLVLAVLLMLAPSVIYVIERLFEAGAELLARRKEQKERRQKSRRRKRRRA